MLSRESVARAHTAASRTPCNALSCRVRCECAVVLARSHREAVGYGPNRVHVDHWEGRILSDDMELLRQRVTKQGQKLEQARAVVDLTQARLDAASAAHEDADRERKRKESALELAKSRAKRLAKETKRARRLSEAVGQDRADAENELAERLETREKRQSKLAKAEAALAAAQATQDVEQAAAKKTTTPRKRTASATRKTATPRKRTSPRRQPPSELHPSARQPSERQPRRPRLDAWRLGLPTRNPSHGRTGPPPRPAWGRK